MLNWREVRRSSAWGILVAILMGSSVANATVLIPTFADMNCDGTSNVVDVQ